MNATDKVLFEKMLEHIDELIDDTKNVSYEQFINDSRLKRACAFSLAQIHENAFATETAPSSKKLSKEALDLLPKEWRDGLYGIRQRVIHGYGSVDFGVLWDTLINDIPALGDKIREILETTPFPDKVQGYYDIQFGDGGDITWV